MAYVILLHFDQPVNPNHPARHYLEYAENIRLRLADHVSGDRTRTSGIMYACYERNIKYVVARIWIDATRRDEYRLRQLNNNPKLCPICNPALRLYTPYNAYDPGTWQTIRQQPDLLAPRYGDLETLPPYKYKPKHRTRSNGESNRTSGSASTWRQDTKTALASIDTSEATIAGALGVPPALLSDDRIRATIDVFSYRDTPADERNADYGFDADIPL